MNAPNRRYTWLVMYDDRHGDDPAAPEPTQQPAQQPGPLAGHAQPFDSEQADAVAAHPRTHDHDERAIALDGDEAREHASASAELPAIVDDQSSMPAPEEGDHGDAPTDALPNELSAAAAHVADNQLHKLDPRFIPAERFGWWIFNAIMIAPPVVTFGLELLFDWWLGGLARMFVWLGIGALTALLIGCTLLLPQLSYRHTRYRVSEIGIEIRRGIFWRRVIHVPKSRVQHTDVTQGPLQRRYGIASMKVFTAGTSESSVSLSGLEYQRAMLVRDFLITGGDGDGV